jgi:hypothetical protein
VEASKRLIGEGFWKKKLMKAFLKTNGHNLIKD